MKTNILTVLLMLSLVFSAAVRAETPVNERTIVGTVVDENDAPVSGTEVYVVFDHDKLTKSRFTKTDADGRFRIDVSDEAFTPYDDTLTAVVYAESSDKKSRASYSYIVNKYGKIEEQTLKMSPVVRVRAKILDESGVPISGARFRLIPTWLNHLEEVQSDAEGNVEYTLTQTTLELRSRYGLDLNICVSKPGYGFEVRALPELPKDAKEFPPMEFRLARGKSVTFRVLDPEGKPMEDAMVTLANTQKPESEPHYVGIAGKTNAQGEYVFDMVPENADRMFHFAVDCPNLCSVTKYPLYDPESKFGKDEPIEVKTLAPVRLSGTIRDEQGNPLPETMLWIYSRGFSQTRPHYHRVTKTDADGKYFFDVYPDLVYLRPQIISSPPKYEVFECDPRVVFPGKPIDDFDFTAQKLYKVRCEIAISDKVRKSMEAQHEVDRYIYFQFIDKDMNPAQIHERRTVLDSNGEELVFSNQQTKVNCYLKVSDDDTLTYEAYLPKGEFKTTSNNNLLEPASVTVTGEAEETVLHLTALPQQTIMPTATTERQKTLYFGRVVRKNAEDELVPVEGVIVEDELLDEIELDNETPAQTRTDAKGEYSIHSLSSRNQPSFYARTEDFSEVGYGSVVKKSEEIEIELHKAASLKVRLIDPKTGKPVTNSKIECTGPVRMRTRVVGPPYFKDLRSDAEGYVSMKGFIPHELYQMQCEPIDPEENMGPSAMLGIFCALESGEFDAGEIEITDVRSSREIEEFINAPYQQKESAKERYEKALAKSKESNKPVLVFFVDTGAADEAMMMWVMNVTFGLQGRNYLEAYEYVPVDLSTELQQNTNAEELAKQLGVTLPENGDFLIYVTNSEGKMITKRESPSFYAPRFNPDGSLDNAFDPVMLLTFLREFGK